MPMNRFFLFSGSAKYIELPATLVLILLLAFFTPSEVRAHCKGKHTGSHPHCAGGEDPPPPSVANPVIVALDKGNNERIVAMDGVLFVDRMSETALHELQPRLDDFETVFRHQQQEGEIAPDDELKKQLQNLEPS